MAGASRSGLPCGWRDAQHAASRTGRLIRARHLGVFRSRPAHGTTRRTASAAAPLRAAPFREDPRPDGRARGPGPGNFKNHRAWAPRTYLGAKIATNISASMLRRAHQVGRHRGPPYSSPAALGVSRGMSLGGRLPPRAALQGLWRSRVAKIGLLPMRGRRCRSGFRPPRRRRVRSAGSVRLARLAKAFYLIARRSYRANIDPHGARGHRPALLRTRPSHTGRPIPVRPTPHRRGLITAPAGSSPLRTYCSCGGRRRASPTR